MSKQKWILADWDGNTLRPHAAYDRESLDYLPRGKPVRVQVNNSRSNPRLRLYWVTLRQVVKNTEVFATDTALHKLLLVACGVTEPFIDLEGNITLQPSSIAFEAMLEDEFKAYFDRAMEVIATKIMPGVDLKLLLREARQEGRIDADQAA